MVFNNVPLTVQRFEHNVLSPEFPDAVFFLNLLEAPSLLRRYFFFFYDFQSIGYLISLINSKALGNAPCLPCSEATEY